VKLVVDSSLVFPDKVGIAWVGEEITRNPAVLDSPSDY
jgi:hypothetical protein